MIHGLPKRPVTTIPPVGRTASSGGQPRSQIHAAHATQAHHPPPPPPTTTVPLSNVLTSSSEVFLSQISLPERPVIHYRQFGPIDGVPNPHQAVEVVRKSIIKEWDSKGILDTYLAVVRADKLSLSIWVFVVGSEGAAPSAVSLEALHFDDMYAIRNGSFSPDTLFPCSPDCSHLPKPCPNCNLERPPIQNNLTSSCLLPRTTHRVPYAAFLDAVRDRLVDKITLQQQARPRKDTESPILRLNHGFILSQRSSEVTWGKDWNADEERHWRKLVHCYLQISLLPTRLLIQPTFSKLPLKHLPNDATPGSPVVLLPYGAPAHYLGPYIGPTREHESSFGESLEGLGCSEWNSEGFVVCWITVRNNAAGQHAIPSASASNGDERGLMVVWPKALCLLSQSPGRTPLTTLPSISSSVCPPVSPPRPGASTGSNGEASGEATNIPPRPSSDVPTHTQSTLYSALKAMTIKGHPNGFGSGFDSVATEMNSYVDWILRERERERERAVREKEREKMRKDGDRHSQGAGGLIRQATSRSSASQSSLQVPSIVPRTSGQSVPSSSRHQGSAANPQGYYPSPPEVASPATSFPDPSRLSAEISTQLSESAAGPSDDAGQPSDGIPAPEPDAQAQAMEAQREDQTADLERQTSAPIEIEMDMDMEMGGLDVTEDDFNFWDEPSAELPSAPSKETELEATNAPPVLMVDTSIPLEVSAASATSRPSATLPEVQVDGPPPAESKPPESASSETLSRASSKLKLPLSPAQTPPIVVEQPASPTPESSSFGSEYSSSDSEDAEESAIPPDFPYRVKEYVHHNYLPLPVTAASILSDLQYSVPGGKFCFPPSSVASPASRPEDSDKADEPIPTNAFIRSLPVPESNVPSTLPLPIQQIASKLLKIRGPISREVEALEKQRSKHRAESRKQRERPIRDGNFEIWHSKKFVDKFISQTDPRVKQVRRLRGRKRNLEWSPYPYLRTENDGDARSNWKRWAEFTEILPSEEARILSLEESSDEETITGDEDEATIAQEISPPSHEGADGANPSNDDKNDGMEPPKTPIAKSATPVVPHGSALLQTLFHPNHVFPLAMVRTSTLAPQQAAPIPVPISVPTPVSPAAHFIQGGEAALMVEGAADVITREVIENPSWAAAYRATFGWTASEPVWAMEADYLAHLVGQIPSVKTKTSLAELGAMTNSATEPSNLKPLVPTTSPLISVGQSNAVLHVNVPALRFWDKLGMSPLNGKKDVVSFALYEEGSTDPERLVSLSKWMKDVARVYTSKRLGRYKVGSDDPSYMDGLIPFKWDAVKKTLTSLILNPPTDAEHVVFYFVTEAASTLIGSKEFRQLSSVIANVQSAIPHFDDRILFHFVPKSLVYQSSIQPGIRGLGLDAFVVSLYNRILKKVSRIIPRHLYKRQMLRSDRFIQAPAFVLARGPPKLSFLLVDWPPPSDDVADRHTFLHVGYQLSESKEWLFIAGIDERGEGHKFKVWYVGACDSEDEVYDKVARRVMAFAWDCASRARVEWSVVIARSGSMSESELIAWEKCLHREVLSQEIAIHVTLVSAEQNNPLAILATNDILKSSAVLASTSVLHRAVFHDSSSTSYIVQPSSRIALLPSNNHFLDAASLDITPEPDSLPPTMGSYGSALRSPQISLLPLASAFVFRCPSVAERTGGSTSNAEGFALSISSYRVHVLRTCGSPTSSHRKPLLIQLQDISKNYLALSALARERWSITSFGGLPFHLASVEIMRRVLAYTNDSS